MPTPIFVCGAECGIASTGTASAGVEHWSGTGVTISVVTSGPSPRRSTRCFQHTDAGFLRHRFASTSTVIVIRAYLYFSALPTSVVGSNVKLITAYTNGVTDAGLYWNVSDSTLRCGSGITVASSGFAPSAGVWYLVDIKVDQSTGTWTVDAKINGVSLAQHSAVRASASATDLFVGANSGSLTTTYFTDDIIVSNTAADYPIGPGTCVGLYPNGDRTNSSATPTDGDFGHVYSATTDFGKGVLGGTNLGAKNVESTSWQSFVNPVGSSNTTQIANKTGASTEHLVWTHEALPVTAMSVNGVMVAGHVSSASATANNQKMKLSDSSGNTVTVWDADMSEVNVCIPGRCRRHCS